jgi:hypothetical protein
MTSGEWVSPFLLDVERVLLLVANEPAPDVERLREPFRPRLLGICEGNAPRQERDRGQ